MSESERRKPEEIVTLRDSVLGEMHQGQMYTETEYTLIDKIVRAAFYINIGAAILVWSLYAVVRMLEPTERSILWALMWFFVFGLIYGMFALLLLTYARFTERKEIIEALTPNRRYEWHQSYKQAISEEQMREEARDASRAPPIPAGIGRSYLRHTVFLVLCSMVCCVLGLVYFWKTMM